MSAHRPKATAEQIKRRGEVDARNARMQVRGVPFPHKTSGVFAGKPSAPKK